MKKNNGTRTPPSVDADLPVLFLKQGEYHISDKGPMLIRTILGSSVAVTMHCPELKIGGITHSLLPFPVPGATTPADHIGRFVNLSVRHVLERLLDMGARKDTLEIKVFGGGQLLTRLTGTSSGIEISIGRRNVATALKVIGELDLHVTATDVGGNWGRKLIFYPHRGDVLIKKIVRNVIQVDDL
ncbi:MAG: chemotaxis protein CheD [Thermodesulfobacteriota bacterium]